MSTEERVVLLLTLYSSAFMAGLTAYYHDYGFTVFFALSWLLTFCMQQSVGISK